MFQINVSIKQVALWTLIIVLGAASVQAGELTNGNWNGRITFSASSQAPFQLSIVQTESIGTTGWIKISGKQDEMLPVKSLTMTGDTMRIILDDGRTVAEFAGVFQSDGKRILGEFKQAGGKFPFCLDFIETKEFKKGGFQVEQHTPTPLGSPSPKE